MSQSITAFTAHQFKGIRGTATLHPNGPGLYVIAGPNGAGKSSFVGGIEQLFVSGGIKGTPKPVHEGATEAYVECVTDQFRARRTYKQDGSSKFEAWALDGAKHSSPAAFVAEATGGQIFNTRQFIGMDEKAQRQALLERVELPFDLEALDAARKAAFEGRTDVSREVKRLNAVRGGLATPPAGTPSEEVSAAAILAEYEKARAHNASIDAEIDKLAAAQSAVERADADVVRLTEELRLAKIAAADARKTEHELGEAFRAGPPRINLDLINQKLANIEQTNAHVRDARAVAVAEAELAEAVAKEKALTEKIEALDKQKLDGLAAATFPVPGLGVDDNGITLDGIPFKQQVNAAAQIVVAFDLATSAQPDLRLVFIEDGDMLDAVSLAGIEKIAVDRGYYVLIERDRDNSRELGVVFTDGALSA